MVVANRRGRALTARARLAGQDVLLAKPETYMNLSGLSVAALMEELEIEDVSEDVIVLYDELAFRWVRFAYANGVRRMGITE